MTNVATCTAEGWSMPRYQERVRFKKYEDDMFLYNEITELNIILSLDKQDEKSSPLRRSLFAYVSPYIRFRRFDTKRESKMPEDIRRHLKFRLSNRCSNIVRETFLRSGCSLTKKLSECCGMWGKRIRELNNLKWYQKINTIPGMLQLSRKDKLWDHLSVMIEKFGTQAFGFIPKTYILPRESWRLRQVWEENRGKKWIVKPPEADRGDGIRIINEWWEIPKYRSIIVQRYLSKPKLISGQKFDLRLYVLITSFNPLRIYLYTDGLVRFATMKYINDLNYLNDRYMHLTNTNINRKNTAYRVSPSINSQTGHLWSLKTLWKYLKRDSVDVKAIWNTIQDIVVKTVISADSTIDKILKTHTTSRYSCFEILGFDIILDQNYKPWLLEVNCGPSMCNNTPVESTVKGSLLKDTLNMAGYQLPNSLSVAKIRDVSNKYHRLSRDRACHDQRIYNVNISYNEKEKQKFYASNCKDRNKYLVSILKYLTPDDVRHLISYEDELTQIGGFEKLFPTKTSHSYFQYFNEPKYYNMLFDAWETRHGNNRDNGIFRLQNLCEKKYHLVLAR